MYLTIRTAPGGNWSLALTSAQAPGMTSVDLKLPAELDFDVDGRDEVVIVTVLGGAVSFERGKSTDRYAPGDVYIANSR